ncbi:metallophosphoesterase [Defluviitalea phaphyphila]|uniref:metallophosphoesterase n=1 Tax=Defluviitalea phaphyphila TaxID=1473580 RepID=UPI0007304941|nr:metallophosphoesterase [Defluviitalea phaphyphila]
MAIYAIGDLHLSGFVNKPMDKFGPIWENHQEEIKKNWLEIIKEEDTVLIPGDISWGMTLEEAYVDLEYINNLPGKKILVKGNHDYWWKSVSKLNSLYENMYFLQNNFIPVESYAICGSRGWICPNDIKFSLHDKKIYEREEKRLRLSIELANKNKYNKIIVIMHFPPTNDKLEGSLFTNLFEEYKVEKVIYGHLHGEDSFKLGLKGYKNGIEYKLVSSDYIKFKPILIV